ncbi:hypothetical protein A3734_14370 [Sulfitobacter sp. HI0054]|nr:hypothetical protein A3734_14370 [Sulfitobacter sp. HI0054]
MLISSSTSSFEKPVISGLRSSDVDLRIIIQEFLNRGYIVDLVDARSEFEPKLKYQVIFGFGAPFRKKLVNEDGSCRYVLYLTEAPPTVSRENENRRRGLYKYRNGIMPPTVRSGLFYEDQDFANCDSVILLGDEARSAEVQALIAPNKLAHAILPSIGKSRETLRVYKAHSEICRMGFVQVGTGGAIHKGTDIIAEAFQKLPSLRYDILGHLGVEKFLIEKSENICFHGYIDMDSARAKKVLSNAQFTILHSASEAAPTGLLFSMLYGCIPVISKSCGVNNAFRKFAFFIKSENPDEVAVELAGIADTPVSELKRRSDLARQFAARRDTLSFQAELSEIFDREGL